MFVNERADEAAQIAILNPYVDILYNKITVEDSKTYIKNLLL